MLNRVEYNYGIMHWKIVTVMMILGSVLHGQSLFIDNFDDNFLANHWSFQSSTYTPIEEDGVLKIEYNRSVSSRAWDQFNLRLRNLSFSENPILSVAIKSEVKTNIVLKPENVNTGSDWIELSIPGDGLWHQYAVEMFDVVSRPLDIVYFYFDGGTTILKNGLIEFDNFQIGGDVSTTMNTNLLAKAITDAGRLANHITEGEATGDNPIGDKEVLKTIISGFSRLLAEVDGNSTQELIDAAAYSLYDHCILFEQRTKLDLEHFAVDGDLVHSAKVLLSNLHKLKGPRFMYGQQDPVGAGARWIGDDERSDVKDVTGSHPALFNWDANEITRQKSRDRFSDRIEEYHDRGAVTSFVWHQLDPEGNGFFVDEVSNPNAIAKSLMPGGENNQLFLDKLTQLANNTKTYRDKNGRSIPILFRPYHEHNGHWFWWGTGTPEQDFIDLWQYTVDYLKDELNVHNFLYVFSPDGTQMNTSDRSYTFRYPGEDYVDVHGLDFYFFNGGNDSEQNRFMRSVNQTVESANFFNKPSAITEVGNEGLTIPHWHMQNLLRPIKANETAIQISYLSTWRNEAEFNHYAPFTGHKSVPDFLEFYSDPTTIFLNNIMPGTSDEIYTDELSEASDAAFIYYYKIKNGPSQNVDSENIVFDDLVNFNFTNTTATIGFSRNATITREGIPQESDITIIDFSEPITYTVTSEDGTVQRDYTVSLDFLSELENVQVVNDDFIVDVFPLPAKDFVNIESNNSLKLIETYNLAGQLIRTVKLNNHRELRLNNLGREEFILRLVDANDQQVFRKLIIHR